MMEVSVPECMALHSRRW